MRALVISFILIAAGPSWATEAFVGDGDTLVLNAVSTPPPESGDVVRVITADGWVYPYTVVAAEVRGDSLRLRVGEGPGFTFDASTQRLRLTSFPQREHSGAARVEWNPRATR